MKPENGLNGTSHSLCEVLPTPAANGVGSSFSRTRIPREALSRDHPTPVLDGRQILNAALNGCPVEAIRKYHTDLFNRDLRQSRREGLLEQIGEGLEKNIAALNAFQERLQRQLDCCLPAGTTPRPWSIWTAMEVAVLLFFSIALLLADLNASTMNLMRSGFDFFKDHYLRAALFNLSLIGSGGLAIKAFGHLFPTDVGRRRFTIAIGVAAAVSLFAALPVWSAMYVRMSLDPMVQMTEAASTAANGPTLWAYVLQLSTGNLMAGFLWLVVWRLVETHAGGQGERAQIEKELNRVGRSLQSERRKLGVVEGCLNSLNADRNRFVAAAVEEFKRACNIMEPDRRIS